MYTFSVQLQKHFFSTNFSADSELNNNMPSLWKFHVMIGYAGLGTGYYVHFRDFIHNAHELTCKDRRSKPDIDAHEVFGMS